MVTIVSHPVLQGCKKGHSCGYDPRSTFGITLMITLLKAYVNRVVGFRDPLG